jgi:hypothetical protein
VTSAPLPSARPAEFVFRPRTGIVACVVWAVLSGLWIVAAAQSGWATALQQLPIVGFVFTVVYAACGRPRVLVGADEVVLRNVIRDVVIPYSAITGIQTQYTLTLITAGGGRHQAWAAPASGRFGAARVTEEERRTLSWSGPVDDIPASAGLRSDAGAAAVAIRRRCAQPSGGAEPWTTPAAAPVRIVWASGILITAGVCAAGVLLAQAL